MASGELSVEGLGTLIDYYGPELDLLTIQFYSHQLYIKSTFFCIKCFNVSYDRIHKKKQIKYVIFFYL